jgi:hypothetical protein
MFSKGEIFHFSNLENTISTYVKDFFCEKVALNRHISKKKTWMKLPDFYNLFQQVSPIYKKGFLKFSLGWNLQFQYLLVL